MMFKKQFSCSLVASHTFHGPNIQLLYSWPNMNEQNIQWSNNCDLFVVVYMQTYMGEGTKRQSLSLVRTVSVGSCIDINGNGSQALPQKEVYIHIYTVFISQWQIDLCVFEVMQYSHILKSRHVCFVLSHQNSREMQDIPNITQLFCSHCY